MNTEGTVGAARFTHNLRLLLNLASHVALADNKKRVSLDHLLVAFLVQDSVIQKIILEKIQFDTKALPAKAQMLLKKVSQNLNRNVKGSSYVQSKLGVDKPVFSKQVREILDLAIRFAHKSNAFYIGTEHVFASFLVYAFDHKIEKYRDFVKHFEPLKEFVVDLMDSHKKVMGLVGASTASRRPISPAISAGDQYSPPEHNFLLKYTINLIDYINLHFGGGEHIVPRLKLERKILTNLYTSSTRSVLLVGESGVGKTYAIYDLAIQLAERSLNIEGKYKEIRILNLPELMATIKFATDIEKRFLGILNELFGHEDIILFLDDLHTLIAPVARGGYNLAATLKDFLRSHKVNIVAAIDRNAYEVMEPYYSDLFNLFSILEVKEPSVSMVYKILKRQLEVYSKNIPVLAHAEKQRYFPAIKSIVKLSKDYILEGYLPLKAVHVLEGVLAKKLSNMLDKLSSVDTLTSQYEDIEDKVQHLLEVGDFKQAEKLEKEISKIEAKEHELLTAAGKQTVVTVQDVYDYIAELTGLPINLLDKAELSALQELEGALKKYIISQDHAVRSVAYAVKRGRLGLVNQNKPWASFLFLGPTGVGKTGLAKALAKVLFGDDSEHFIQLDMSEFMEKHSISKLIGSPPGYVGYEEGGYLTERIKETPFAVVLFDEIEKASPDVLNILLQILEDGRLTDSKGQVVSFKHTIIILTSNIGADKLFKDKVSGFLNKDQTVNWGDYSDIKEKLLKQLKKRLRPELINRLDEVIVFNVLNRQQIFRILDNILAELNDRLAKFGIKVTLNKQAKEFLVNKGYSPEYGVRSLKRVVQNQVENVVADYMLTRGKSIYEHPKKISELQLVYSKKEDKLLLKA